VGGEREGEEFPKTSSASRSREELFRTEAHFLRMSQSTKDSAQTISGVHPGENFGTERSADTGAILRTLVSCWIKEEFF